MWLRRILVWSVILGVSAIYWLNLAPVLHTQKQYDDAVIIYFIVLFATFFLIGVVLRLGSGSGKPRRG
jgi:hypothetical protein